MVRFVIRLIRCPKAATAVEYGLIASLIVITMLVGLRAMSQSSTELWGNINNKVAAAR